MNLTNGLNIYEKASSAKVNWEKSEGYLLGDWQGRTPPVLPGGVKWGRGGLKLLGVFLGTDQYRQKNWEGMVEKMCDRLSRWSWVLPQLSYRGRVLVTNNLAASALWHKMNVLDPPESVVEELQRKLVDFFWDGQHWKKSAVLFLPIQEGGQGLIDIKNRIKTFRLQAAQRLLYAEPCWADTAHAVLRKMNIFKYDVQLFLIKVANMDLRNVSPFYKAVLRAWTFKVKRVLSNIGLWTENEPLFNNPLIPATALESRSIQNVMARAGCTRIVDRKTGGNWKSPEEMCNKTGIKSIRIIKRIMDGTVSALPSVFRQSSEDNEVLEQSRGSLFPQVEVSAAVDEEPEEGSLLHFRTPVLEGFETVSKKALYNICVKVSHYNVLKDCKETKWLDLFGPDSSPRRCWRSLYKPPIEKRTADLQWRVVHWAVATNRHVAHIDPTVGKECPFCGTEESIDHLFLHCLRLRGFIQILDGWVRDLGVVFNNEFFIFGPKYVASDRKKNLVN